jgi:hypothetical protein
MDTETTPLDRVYDAVIDALNEGVEEEEILGRVSDAVLEHTALSEKL